MPECLPLSRYTCCLVDHLCNVGGERCRHWVQDWNIGNCCLRCHEPRRQQDIAAIMGVNRSYIGEVERRALSKIRKRSPLLREIWDWLEQEKVECSQSDVRTAITQYVRHSKGVE